MNTAAGTARIRAVSAVVASSLLLLLAFTSPAAARPQEPSGAQASIVHGKQASIRDWPWQVALAVSSHGRPGQSPRTRTFCGGSLLAPDLVITAGHCVADVPKSKVNHISVISGRTFLNNRSAGEETDVARRYMPTYRNGERKYDVSAGAADWDVALLKLRHPVPSPSITIAGNDERKSWRTGQAVKTTGWGITNPNQRSVVNGLRIAGQVMQPERICRRWDGKAFNPKHMVCFGAPSIHASACNGDSGGPLMAPVTTAAGKEYRLVGLTSFGDGYCRGAIPSVDTRVADQPIRGWVKRTAMKAAGVDVIGHGGVAPAVRDWCRVPDLFGLSLAVAKSQLLLNNCRLGSIQRDSVRGLSMGSVTYSNYLPHWLAKPGAKVKVGRTR